MAKKITNIEVKDTTVRTIKHEGEDFVCITDIARQKNSTDPNGVIANWMRNRNTIEFLGIWEQLFNQSFNPLEFEGVRKEAGLNAFTMSPSRWIEATNAKGIVAMAGIVAGVVSAMRHTSFSMQMFTCCRLWSLLYKKHNPFVSRISYKAGNATLPPESVPI